MVKAKEVERELARSLSPTPGQTPKAPMKMTKRRLRALHCREYFYSVEPLPYSRCQAGADPELLFFGGGGGGGQRGGALIIMVWAWLQNIARKRGRCTRGLGRFFTVIMLLRRVFVVFISSARHKTPPLVAMNI